MADFAGFECPPGFFCLTGQGPEVCPAGRMRDTAGATGPTDCPLCRAGYYCPNDTINTQGIPCRETYECPEGASIEIDCRAGHYCNGTTGIPPICPPGYFCKNATDTPLLCEFPDYCPEGSNMTLQCDLGYRAIKHTGIRYDKTVSCEICKGGTYSNSTDRAACYMCPEGYYCPAGTGNGDTYPCEKGYYCPAGSDAPIPCKPGMYGDIYKADKYGLCKPCAAGTFQNREGQSSCRLCGSFGTSEKQSSTCKCKGKHRSYQMSDGACICKTGYIYYDEVGKKKSNGNSKEDCQELVHEHCAQNEVRDASTGKCVVAENVDCTKSCLDGGTYKTEHGRSVLFYSK